MLLFSNSTTMTQQDTTWYWHDRPFQQV